MNSPQAKSIIAERQKVIEEKGIVKEHELPDVKRNLQMEMNRLASQGVLK
jgi:hypothetical protein